MSLDDFNARNAVFLARDTKLHEGVRREAFYLRIVLVVAGLSFAAVLATSWPHPLTASSTLLACSAGVAAWFVGRTAVSVWANRAVQRIMAEHPMPARPEGDPR